MMNKKPFYSTMVMLLCIAMIESSYINKELTEQSDLNYKIAYIAGGNSSREIIMVDLKGNRDRSFSQPKLPGRYFNAVTTTTDGKRMAFMRDIEGIDRYSLWVMNSDGSDLKRLTAKGKEALYPSWANDGSKLAFARRDGGVWEIYTINSDGTGEKRISNFREEGKRPRWGARTSWSADGKRIAYSLSFSSNEDYEIFMTDVDGKNVAQLTDNNYDDRNPDFSPDGNSIAFNISKNGKRETVVLNLKTNKLIFLGNAASGFGMEWSPDGKKIAYSGYHGENRDIFVMNSDGSDQVRLSSSPGLDISPTWVYSK